MKLDAARMALVESVADGTQIDWDALESGPLDPEERRFLRDLRIVARVSEVHRTIAHTTAISEATRSHAGPATNPWGARPAPEFPPADTPRLGHQWGRYILLEEVGRGGFGAVYRAWDPDLRRELAIKLLTRRTGDEPVSERILREGQELAKIRHLNVVAVHDVEKHERQVGLCMEFIRGQTLEALVRAQGPMGAQEALAVGQEVGRALAAVHAAGIVHRDVKARNVMREQAGRIVLMDFGTGRDATRLEEGEGGLTGTPLYMAPEVINGGRATPQSDIYSLGVLLYFLVTGAHPVEGRTIEEIRAAHLHGRYRLLGERRPDLGDSFIRVVERALEPSPEARYASVAALLRDLSVLPPPPKPDVWSTALLAAGALAVAALGITALGFVSSTAFNLTFGRARAFVTESPLDWFVWGARPLIPMAFYSVRAAFFLSIAVLPPAAIWWMLLRLSPAFARWSSRVGARVAGALRRVRLDDPAVLSALVLVIGVLTLVLVSWRFSGLLGASMSFINDADRDRLAPLRPSNIDDHILYGWVLDLLVVGMSVALYKIRRRQQRRPCKPTPAAWIASLGVVAAALVLLEMPYRIIWQNEFERAAIGSETCYIIGESEAQILVHCPDIDPPRNRTLPRADPRLQREHIVENIFTHPSGRRAVP